MSLKLGRTSLRRNNHRSIDTVALQRTSNRALPNSVSFILRISEPAAWWGLEPSNQLRGRSLARDDTEDASASSALGRAPEYTTTGKQTSSWRDDEIQERVKIPVDERLGGCRGFKSHRPHHLSLAHKLRIQPWCWPQDRKSTRLNSSHSQISYAVFCLKKKK